MSARTEDRPQAPAEPLQGSYDYVVVGAGSAGCAVAARLSEDPGCTVLLLEAGGRDTRPEIHDVTLPSLLALWTAPWSAELDWGYRTEPEPGLGGRRVPVARGRVVGGCSSTNALMWVRGHRADYDGWRDLGNEGWGFTDLLPALRRSEDYDGGDHDGGDHDGGGSALRGVGGAVHVRTHRDPTPVARAFVAATRELGFGAEQDYNAGRQHGFGFFYQTSRWADGRRCSTAQAYLVPASGRANLTVATGVRAVRLALAGDRVEGVDVVHQGRLVRVGAHRCVTVCAGAFETPKLLMLSGIGPAAGLARHGVRCRVDLPGVGAGLQDHLFVPVCHRALRPHPPAELVSEAGLFVHSSAADPAGAPDLQFTFGAGTFLPEGSHADPAVPGFTFAPVGLHPASRGRVELRGEDPALPAVVHAGYLTEPGDVDVLVEGVELARELAATTAFDELRGPELAPGPGVRGRAALRRYVAAAATTLWHPVGTCRMGTDEGAVVDARLRVHGVEGLRVADASVMPAIPSGNTNAPTVAIGERAAELIRLDDTHLVEGALT